MIRRAGALGLILAIGFGLSAHNGPRVSASGTTGENLGLALYHNGWDGFYRWPFGAAATGSTDTFRLRSSRAVTKVAFDLVNEANDSATPYPMKLQSHTGTQDFWEAAVVMPAKPGQMGYHFRVQAGANVRWYGDNSSVGESGPGQAYGSLQDVLDYTLTVYQAGFTTPGWLQKSVMYEIFPDRFYDGDTSNDALEATGTKYGYIDTIFHSNWNALPVENNPCPDPSGFGNDNCDFFGGDLQGIIDKLPYLHSLGITAVYLTPIFLAPSNHKYDTSNFKEIDPEFGTLQTFHTLATDAKQLGIHLILDGAFEDTGSDSVYFDYYGNFASQYGPGACDSNTSPYYTWYSIYSSTDCSLYKKWFGILTLPSINDDLPAVRNFFYKGPQSVAQYWLQQGASGWRLDSADQISDSFWQGFRTNVKAAFPTAGIMGEDFSGDPTSELLGTEWDGSMNYRFRDPALDFFANGNGSQNRTAEGASDFMETEMGLLSEEPWQADLASMNILDSQDTVRLFSSVRGSMKAMRLVSLFQMTWPGVPTIFYGDEAGLRGLGDPDNRRTFPWDHQNTVLEAYYAKVIHMRLAINALIYGSVTPLLMNDATRTVAYLRHTTKQSVVVALNDSATSETVKLPVTMLKSGTVLTDQLAPYSATVVKGIVTVSLPPMSGRVLLTTAG